MPLIVTHFGSLPIIEHLPIAAPCDLPVPSRRRAIEAFEKINLLLDEYSLPEQLFDELSIINAFLLTR